MLLGRRNLATGVVNLYRWGRTFVTPNGNGADTCERARGDVLQIREVPIEPHVLIDPVSRRGPVSAMRAQSPLPVETVPDKVSHLGAQLIACKPLNFFRREIEMEPFQSLRCQHVSATSLTRSSDHSIIPSVISSHPLVLLTYMPLDRMCWREDRSLSVSFSCGEPSHTSIALAKTATPKSILSRPAVLRRARATSHRSLAARMAQMALRLMSPRGMGG